MKMRVSNKGLLEIAEHEGIVPAPYYDSVGVATFGIGHTASAGGPNPEAMARGMPSDVELGIDHALQVFADDLKQYEERVDRWITRPLEQHEFDALVSFDFNTGGIWYYNRRLGKRVNAKLVVAINAGDPDAAKHFMGWLKPPELLKRRRAEQNLFLTGDYDSNGTSIPIWRVDENMRLKGIYANIEGKELLKRMKPYDPNAGKRANPKKPFLKRSIGEILGLERT